MFFKTILQHYSENRKLIYCSRTVPEIEKALAELQILIEYRKSQGVEESFLGIGLTSRKNLCLHPTVSQQKWGKVVDAKCRNLTASWVRDKSKVDSNVELCDFYEVIINFILFLEIK